MRFGQASVDDTLIPSRIYLKEFLMAYATPPGWPTPPEGWTPPPGWQPDPSWPAPPKGWDFWPAETSVLSSGPVPSGAAHPSAGGARPWYKKKRFVLPLGVLLLFVVIGVFGGGGEGPTTADPTAQVNAEPSLSAEDAAAQKAAEEAKAAEAKAAKDAAAAAAKEAKDAAEAAANPGIGVPVRDGKFEFTVSGVTCGVPEVGTAPLNKVAQGQYCLVDVTVKNIGDKSQMFFGSNQYAYNAAAQKYTADTSAAIYLPEANSLFVDINPGNQLTGKIIFDIPAGATLTKIELHDSAFSGGVKVALS